MVYAGLVASAQLRFRDGQTCKATKDDNGIFYEQLYRRINESNGFSYDGNLVTCPNGTRLRLPDWQAYSHVLDEVFSTKCYGSPDLTKRTTIDVGASIADSSLYFESLGAEVYAYEPDMRRCALAEENIILNNKTKKIHLFKQAANANALAQLMELESLNDVFLKMDCEGCEFEIVAGLPEEALRKIRNVVIEYHARRPTPLIRRLGAAGFNVSVHREIMTADRV